MNKTEVRRLKVRRALKALIINHNAFNIEDADGGRMDFCVEGPFGHTYQCQFTRNGFDVAVYDDATTVWYFHICCCSSLLDEVSLDSTNNDNMMKR